MSLEEDEMTTEIENKKKLKRTNEIINRIFLQLFEKLEICRVTVIKSFGGISSNPSKIISNKSSGISDQNFGRNFSIPMSGV